jgi:hypothetical protein
MCFVLSPLFLVCSAYKYAARSFFFLCRGVKRHKLSLGLKVQFSRLWCRLTSQNMGWSWLLPVAVTNMVAGSSWNLANSGLLREALTIRVADLQLSVAGGSKNLDCSWLLGQIAFIIADGFPLTFFRVTFSLQGYQNIVWRSLIAVIIIL